MGRFIALDGEQQKVLRLCRKKRRLNCRDADWDILTDLVRKGVVDRVVDEDPKSFGWSYYKLSRRGKRYLDEKNKSLNSNSK
jgi:hypothetical protein